MLISQNDRIHHLFCWRSPSRRPHTCKRARHLAADAVFSLLLRCCFAVASLLLRCCFAVASLLFGCFIGCYSFLSADSEPGFLRRTRLRWLIIRCKEQRKQPAPF